MGLQDRAHQDAGAAAPHAGLDEIAGRPFADRGFDQLAQVREFHAPDHRVGAPGPVASQFPERRVEGFSTPGARQSV